MNSIPRRTLADLTARYSLEPTLKDIYVEGQYDQEIIERICIKTGEAGAVVYSIDAVDISAEMLTRHGLTLGNKQRVIVLARELAGAPPAAAFRCLVDKDLDQWFGALECTARLVWTEHASLELYFFNDTVLREVLITTARCRIPKWDIFRESMTAALRELYLLRLADRELCLNLRWMSPDRCLSLDSGCVIFDMREFTTRLLSSNSLAKEETRYLDSVERWRLRTAGDPRHCIHGHDFIEMLVWVILKSKGQRSFASVDAISRVLVLLALEAKAILRCLA